MNFKKNRCYLVIFSLLFAGCQFLINPIPTVTPTPTLAPTLPSPTITPAPKAPDLGHHPLYWFAPLPPLPTDQGRPFIGSEDFMELFEPVSPWTASADKIQVFKLYGEWVGNHPGDALLRQAVENIERRGLALAIETGPLDPDGCGFGVEGFATVESGLQMARAIESVGGTLHFIALDEPYYYGHFYDGPNACHWTAEKIAQEVGEFIKAVQVIFPDVIVGDTEPLSGPAGAAEYQAWLDTFYQVNGYHLAFIHMDIDWSRPGWPTEVDTLQQYGSQIGVPVGIIYNGNSFDKTDEDYLAAMGERVKKLELVNGVQPDHVLFQSWNDKPDRVLPETAPFTFTGFIKRYFTDKVSLGYSRTGVEANLALEKPVRVSGQFNDLVGELAVDGELGTIWNSGGGPVQWLEIDLGNEYNLSQIKLMVSQYPSGLTMHLVKAAKASRKFIVVHQFEGNTQDGDELVFHPESPLTGMRYIRIETLTSPSWVSWREIIVTNAGE